MSGNVVDLCQEYSKFDFNTMYDTVSQLLRVDTSEISRICPGGDHENLDFYAAARERMLAEKPGFYENDDEHKKIVDFFHAISPITNEEACVCIQSGNYDTFIYLCRQYFGASFKPPQEVVDEITREYMERESDVSTAKMLCIVPFITPDNKKVAQLAEAVGKKNT